MVRPQAAPKQEYEYSFPRNKNTPNYCQKNFKSTYQVNDLI